MKFLQITAFNVREVERFTSCTMSIVYGKYAMLESKDGRVRYANMYYFMVKDPSGDILVMSPDAFSEYADQYKSEL